MKRILVVDDEFPILDVLRAFLEEEGYKVLVARDGEDAVEILSVSGVDLMITDTMMPRRGGISLVRWLRDQDALQNIPVIVTSVSSFANWIGLDVAAFVSKPFDLNDLLEVVATALRSSPMRDNH